MMITLLMSLTLQTRLPRLVKYCSAQDLSIFRWKILLTSRIDCLDFYKQKRDTSLFVEVVSLRFFCLSIFCFFVLLINVYFGCIINRCINYKPVVSQMVVIFILMLIGFLLRKKNVVEENAYANLSKMEMFIFMPALNLYNQMTNCTVSNLKENAPLILYGGVTIIVAIFIATFLSKLFVPEYKENREAAYQRNIYKYVIIFFFFFI